MPVPEGSGGAGGPAAEQPPRRLCRGEAGRRAGVRGEQPQHPPVLGGRAALAGAPARGGGLRRAGPPRGAERGWPRAGSLRSAVAKSFLRAAPAEPSRASRGAGVAAGGGGPPPARGWGARVGAGGAAELCHPRGGGHVEAGGGGSPFVVIPSAGGAPGSAPAFGAASGLGGLVWVFFFSPSSPSSCRQSGSAVRSFR